MAHKDKGKLWTSEAVWNRYEMKLLVNVLEVSDIPPSKKKLDTYVKLSFGKQGHRTKSHKGAEPVFNEMFFFDAKNLKEPSLFIELINSAGVMDSKIGQLEFPGPSSLLEETVIDEEYQFKRNPKKKPISEQHAGKIHLRLYFSRIQEARLSSNPLDHNYYYESVMDQFKTGDVIVFNDVGLIGTLAKMYGNTPYSRVGMVVRLPNKWTERIEPYLLELTRNVDRMLDAFKGEKKQRKNYDKKRTEIPVTGICLFRMFERIHQLRGMSIWWSPLKMPLSESEETKMVEWIWKEHASRSPDCLGQVFNPYHTQAREFLSNCFGLPRNPKKSREYAEFFSISLVINCLRQAGVEEIDDLEGEALYVADLIQSKFFESPLLLRGSKWEIKNLHPIPEPPPDSSKKRRLVPSMMAPQSYYNYPPLSQQDDSSTDESPRLDGNSVGKCPGRQIPSRPVRRGTNPAQQDNIGTLQDPPPISLSDIEKVNGTSEKDEEDEDATPNHSPPSTPVDQWKPQQQPSLQQQPTQQPSFQQQPTQQQQPSFQQQEPQQQWQSQQTSMGQWQPPPLEQQSSHDQWQPQQQSSFQQHQGTNGQWQPQQQQQWQPQPQQQLDQQLQLDQQQQQDQQQRSSPPIWGVQKQGGSSAFIATEPPPLHPPQAGASDPGLYSYPGSLYQNYDSPQQKRNASSFSQYGGSFQPANSGNDNGGGVSPPSNPDSTPPPTRGRAFSLLPGDLGSEED